MLRSVTLENFKSFGVRQTVPLQPISVLVGPNNSGKSCFMSLGELVRQAAGDDGTRAQLAAVGPTSVIHRPREDDARLFLEWSDEHGLYHSSVNAEWRSIGEGLTDHRGNAAWSGVSDNEQVLPVSGTAAIPPGKVPRRKLVVGTHQFGWLEDESFAGLRAVWRHARQTLPAARTLRSLIRSRHVKLALASLRADAPFSNSPVLEADGTNLAAVLSVWRGLKPELTEQLDDALRRSAPEIRHALVQPAPTGNQLRLWFRQADGEHFDATQVSDGVLYFTALLMHVLAADPGAVLFIEEPEQSIHPRRLHDVVELLRRMVKDHGSQFVVATHSPSLVNEFRDEPEAILLFRRSESGTLVTPLTESPKLMEALDKVDPGEMLADGFFNNPL